MSGAKNDECVCRMPHAPPSAQAAKSAGADDSRRGPEYDQLVATTVAALRARYGPSLLIHWEDFASRNSYRLLQRFRDEVRAQRQSPLERAPPHMRLMPGAKGIMHRSCVHD